MRFIRLIILVPIFALFSNTTLFAQNVVENEESYLKEFDLESFKDAAIKIKDSSVLFQHILGVKYGYAISGVSFSHTKIHKSIKSSKNFGLYYTYLHSLLNTMPYFGIQIGLASTQVGYIHVTETAENEYKEEPQVYDALEFPMLSVFRAEIDRIRLMLGIGGYLSYIYGTELPDGIIPSTTKRGCFGVMGQAGVAIKLHPVELHLEAGYKYGLTPFLDHKFYSEHQWIYTHSTQLQFSAGVNFVIGKKYHKKK